MKTLTKISPVLFLLIFPAVIAAAQTELVRSNYYPAELEFRELGPIKLDQTLTEADSLAGVEGASLFEDVGFTKYSRRVYTLESGGTLSVEVVRLEDPRASYSLLTLMRTSDIADGPPGDWYSTVEKGVIFAQRDMLVRVRSDAGPGDLARRVAVSVGNRIGNRNTPLPRLVSHFPKSGLDASSVRYFLGPRSYESFAASTAGPRLKFESDMEVAQAKYEIQDMKGLLSLVSFPTGQLAEQYFENPAALESGPSDGTRVYLKRTGPLLGILQGNFDAGTADKILDSLQYAYAIKWIYDKNNRSNAKTVWGVPMPILGTVVRSLLLTALLCGFSVLAGVGFAVFRLALRGYAPRNYLDRPERTEIIRLKIDES